LVDVKFHTRTLQPLALPAGLTACWPYCLLGLLCTASAGSYVPSILLVSAVLVLGGVLALTYRGDKQHLRYSHLVQDSKQDPQPATGSQLQQQQQQQAEEKRRQQRQQRQQKARQSPESEVELLRGSSGDSLYSHSPHSS
jgi:hypothetical protein